MTPRWTNQYICRASWNVRGARAGTHEQTSSMRANSSRRVGFVSIAAKRRASSACRSAKRITLSQAIDIASSSSTRASQPGSPRSSMPRREASIRAWKSRNPSR